MYIRRVSRKNKNGTSTAYLQLAHNEWDPEAKYAKAKVIYSFGREDQVDKAVLERLAASISRFLSPEAALKSKETVGEVASFLFQSSKSVGSVWILDQMWKKLGMDRVIEECFSSREHDMDIERILFSMVANRAVSPSSKHAMTNWVEEDVYIPGLETVQSHQLYRVMDELLSVRDEFEKNVFYAVSDLLNLEVDLLYFDTTSSYFEVSPDEVSDEETFRKQGYSKDKRSDLLQTVIGLAVTREGIPIRVWEWPGNTMDMTVIDQVKKDLVGWKLGRVIQVADRGFSSEENLRILQRTGGHYIVGERMHAGKKDVEEALSKRGRFRVIRENLHAKEVIVGNGEARKRYVIAYNPDEARRDKQKREQIVQSVEEQLAVLKQESDSAHHKKACALRAHRTYGKYVRQLKDGSLRLDKQAIRDASAYDGKYLIRTSDDTLSMEDIVLGYKQLLQVEDAFRTLKTTLRLRPMYHRLEERIRAHILISWLALLLVRIIEVQSGDTWASLRQELNRLHVGHFTTKDGDLFRCTELNQKQRTIFRSVDIEPPPTIMDIQPTN